MRVLVVEDDVRISGPIAAALRRLQHNVDVAADGDAALAWSDIREHDIVLLDVMLPGIDGVAVCRAMRERGSQASILMLTARDSVRDKLAALDSGADDYVVKPFELDELLARIRALSRRRPDPRDATLRHGDIELDEKTACVSCNGLPVELTRTEFAILETLLRHPTRVFSQFELYERTGDLDSSGTPATIKTHLVNLRKKLAAGTRRDAIETVRGFGYRLADA
jgi:DNA-binding response OmpR family regulator